MKKIDGAALLTGGLLIGFLSGVWVMEAFGYHGEAVEIRNECEKNLPRSEQCVMRFVKDDT